MKKRCLVPHILNDLDEKMVFIGGARWEENVDIRKDKVRIINLDRFLASLV